MLSIEQKLILVKMMSQFFRNLRKPRARPTSTAIHVHFHVCSVPFPIGCVPRTALSHFRVRGLLETAIVGTLISAS
jgi:hypothetical protein